MTKTRLTQTDWIEAGYRALAARGPEALKAEPLARDLNTTKGSFYWHFQDVAAYRNALLGDWQARAMHDLEADADAVPRLRALAGHLAEAEPVESALRAWARGDAAAAKAVARVDAARLTLVAGLLAETGIRNPEMARILCATAVGMRELGESETAPGPQAMESLVDLMLALR